MTDTPWTPGPWRAYHWNAAAHEFEDNRESPFVVTFPNETNLITELQANAHLIAAAPDMAEALDHSIQFILAWRTEYPDLTDPMRKRVEAAIAKVEAARSKARGQS